MGKSAYLVGHKEQGTHLEARVLRTQPLRIVLFLNVDKFFRGGNGFERNVVVVAVLENNQASTDIFKEQIQGKVAIGHRRDGVNGVGIAATHEIAELLVDDVDSFSVIEFGGEVAHSFRHDFANAAELFVAEGVGLHAFENHFAAFEHSSLRDENNRVL